MNKLKENCVSHLHETEGACYRCCEGCNYERHICHFCGTILTHNSYEYNKGKLVRHFLSDCRPDIIADGTKDGPMA